MILTNINPSKLMGEFIKAGIDVNNMLITSDATIKNPIATKATLHIDSATNTDLIAKIIDAHDPTPIPPPPTQDDFLIDLELRMTMLELGISL